MDQEKFTGQEQFLVEQNIKIYTALREVFPVEEKWMVSWQFFCHASGDVEFNAAAVVKIGAGDEDYTTLIQYGSKTIDEMIKTLTEKKIEAEENEKANPKN